MKQKAATKDFNIADLPSNRKEVFFDCLKNRYKYFMYCGFVIFLCTIPLLIIYFLKTLDLGSLLIQLNDERITVAEYNMAKLSHTLIFDGLIILSSLIISIAISGITRVIRQIGWEEPIFFLRDFGDGIKMNYKYIFVHLFILSIIYLIADLSLNIKTGLVLFQYIPIVIFIFIAIPTCLFSIAQTNIYNISLFKSIGNSLLFMFKALPGCIIFSLIISLIAFIRYIPNIMILLMILSLLIIFVFPLYYFGWFLYSSYIFDKFFNIDFYPELIDKGINRKEK